MAFMSLLAALGSAVGKGAGAYVDERNVQDEKAQRALMTNIAVERAAREKALWNREQAERTGMAQAGADVAPVAAEPVYQPEVDDGGVPMLPNPTIGMVRMGADPTRLTPQQGAEAAALQNTTTAKRTRQAVFLGGMGEVGKSRAVEETIRTMQKEGHADFISGNFAHAPTVEQLNAGGDGTFNLVGVDTFNKTGGTVRIPQGARGQAFVTKNALGQDTTDFRLVDASGQPLPGIPSARQYENFYAKSGPQREADELKAFTFKSQADQRAAEERNRLRDDTRADDLAKSTIDYHKIMGKAALGRVDVAASKASGTLDRMPEADRRTYDAALKRREKLAETIDKAKADGMWDPGKNAGHKSLQADFDAAGVRATTLERRYAGSGASADPYRVRDGAQVSPADQARRDAEGGALRLRSEYGGDVNKARSALTRLDAEAAKATGETRTIIQSDAAQLRAAIEVASRTTATPAATPRPTTVPASAAPPGPVPSIGAAAESAGAALDKVRAVAEAATVKLRGYGSVQRQADPQGYAAAKAAAAAASDAVARADQEYRATLNGMPTMTAFGRFARP